MKTEISYHRPDALASFGASVDLPQRGGNWRGAGLIPPPKGFGPASFYNEGMK